MTTKEPHALDGVLERAKRYTTPNKAVLIDRETTSDMMEIIDKLSIALRQYMAQPAECFDCSHLIIERDNAQDMADKLADKISEMTGVDIGEHSNLNCPWENALKAELPQLTDVDKQAALDEMPNTSDTDELGRWVFDYRTTIRAALQTPAQPVNQMLLDALKEIIDGYEHEYGADMPQSITARKAITAAEAIPKTETVGEIDGLGEAIERLRKYDSCDPIENAEAYPNFSSKAFQQGDDRRTILEAARRYHNMIKKEG